MTFFEWLECHEFDDTAIYHCGDLNGRYYDCIRFGDCEEYIVSTEDESRYNCTRYDYSCQNYNGCNNFNCVDHNVTFDEWLECRT